MSRNLLESFCNEEKAQKFYFSSTVFTTEPLLSLERTNIPWSYISIAHFINSKNTFNLDTYTYTYAVYKNKRLVYY